MKESGKEGRVVGRNCKRKTISSKEVEFVRELCIYSKGLGLESDCEFICEQLYIVRLFVVASRHYEVLSQKTSKNLNFTVSITTLAHDMNFLMPHSLGGGVQYKRLARRAVLFGRPHSLEEILYTILHCQSSLECM